MSEFREEIKSYLELKTNLDIAARRVMNEKRDIHIAARDYGLQYRILQQKVDILRRLYDYDEEKIRIEIAVNSVLYGHKTVEEAARVNKVYHGIIETELSRYNALNNNKINAPYEYDTNLFKGRYFTFKEELSLLAELRQWKFNSPLPCTCLICAMEQLASLIYQFVKKKSISYPQMWNTYKQADANCLICFEMVHSIISKLYPHYDNNVQQLYETCRNKQ